MTGECGLPWSPVLRYQERIQEGGRAGGRGDGTLRGASWENPVTKLLQAASGGLGPFSPFLPAP